MKQNSIHRIARWLGYLLSSIIDHVCLYHIILSRGSNEAKGIKQASTGVWSKREFSQNFDSRFITFDAWRCKSRNYELDSGPALWAARASKNIEHRRTHCALSRARLRVRLHGARAPPHDPDVRACCMNFTCIPCNV